MAFRDIYFNLDPMKTKLELHLRATHISGVLFLNESVELICWVNNSMTHKHIPLLPTSVTM